MEKIIKNNNIPQVILRYILKEFLDIDTLVNLLYSVDLFKFILVPYRDYYVALRGFYWCCDNGDIYGAKFLYHFEKRQNNICLNEEFMASCMGGHLELAKWLFSMGCVNIKYKQNIVFRSCLFDSLLDIVKWIHSLNEIDFNNCQRNSLEDIFGRVCENNQIQTAKWLYNVEKIDIHVDNDYPFYISCCKGNFEIAKWLYSIDGKINNSICFIKTCENGHLEIAKWLYSLKNIQINKHEAFMHSCENGHLEISEWLYSLGEININAENDKALRLSCESGNLETAKWLYLKGGRLNFSYNVFKESCLCGHIEVVKWLYSIGFYDFSDNLIDKVYKNGYLNIVFWMYGLEKYENINTYFSSNYKGNKFDNIGSFFDSITIN